MKAKYGFIDDTKITPSHGWVEFNSVYSALNRISRAHENSRGCFYVQGEEHMLQPAPLPSPEKQQGPALFESLLANAWQERERIKQTTDLTQTLLDRLTVEMREE